AADGPVAQSVPLGMAGLASRSASSPASKLASTQASPAASLPSPMAVVASQASKAAAASSLAPTAPWDAESIPLLTEQIMPLAPALHVEAAPAAFKSIVNVQDGQAQGASAVADFPTLPVTGVESDGEPAASMPTPQADEVIIVAASGVQRVVNDSTTTLALQAESRQAPQGDVLVVSTQGAQTLSDAMDDTLDLRSIMRRAGSDSASSEASYAMAQVPQLPAWVVMDPETRRLVPQRLAPR
ncbi:MAG: hypothetical protein JWP36_136, partial [Paucimonas sp.]|nr:hypothetical protein [Paucimonas sp.]